MTEAVEIERKYDAGAPVSLRLDGLPGVSAVDGPTTFELEALYHDTDDLRLARSGVSLRRRTGGEDAGWHLKLPSDLADGRLEVRLPLESSADEVPAKLVDLALSRTRGGGLRPVGRLRTTRTRWRLLDADGEALAEVVADDVSAQTMGGSATLTRWYEVEVELAGDGTGELLDAVEERLGEHGVRPSQWPSKLRRLLGDRLGETTGPAAAADGEPTAGDAVLAYLRAQADALVRLDPGVRRDQPDAVHQMRVAARRARSALQSFRAVLDRERTDDLVAELRWLGRVLAEARDAEVQRGALLSQLDALPPELVVGPVVSRVDSHFARAGAQAREALLEQLRGPRYLALLDALHALLDDPPLTERAAEPAGAVLPRQVAKAQRRVRRAIRRYQAAPASTGGTDGTGGADGTGGTDRDAALHEARKAAKRARYAAEAARPVAGKAAKRTARRLKAVQSLLGDHQDSAVARDLLRELGIKAHLDGENAFSYGVLLGHHLDRAQRLRGELPQVWSRAEQRKARRWMR